MLYNSGYYQTTLPAVGMNHSKLTLRTLNELFMICFLSQINRIKFDFSFTMVLLWFILIVSTILK